MTLVFVFNYFFKLSCSSWLCILM